MKYVSFRSNYLHIGSVVVAVMYKNLSEIFISDNNVNGAKKTRFACLALACVFPRTLLNSHLPPVFREDEIG